MAAKLADSKKESDVGGLLHRCGRVGFAVNRSGIVCPLGVPTLEGVNTAAKGKACIYRHIARCASTRTRSHARTDSGGGGEKESSVSE